MATSTISSSARLAVTTPAWARRFLPSFSDCFFLAILIWLFIAGASGWKALLMDGDTGWHIRAGEYILQHHAIPASDLFSFSKPGAPWFAWEWLSDAIFGGLFRFGGLKAVVLFCGVLISLFSTILLRFALWRGANVMLALPLTLLAIGSSTIHFLARPHLFTLVLLPVSLWIVEADRLAPGWKVWLLIPLTCLWTNLHGGFAMFLACLALLALGTAGESWSSVRRYGLLFLGCSAATLVNPFGIGLHRHILDYLQANWIRDLVQEFQAPAFRSEGQFQFEMLLLMGLMIAAVLIGRRRLVEPLWLLFLAHCSLTSVRHAPLFAAIAAPIVAAELTALWSRFAERLDKTALLRILYELGLDLGPAFRRATAWVAVALVVIACIDAPIAWPKDFPREAFPVDIVHRNAGTLTTGRILTTDQWADYLIFSFYPAAHVFMDGRSDFYGEELGRQYLALMQGAFSAESVFHQQRFDTALIPVEWPLTQLLKRDTGWRVIEDDGRAILFTAVKPTNIDTPRPNENASDSRN